VLPETGKVHEPDVDVLNAMVADKLEDVLRRLGGGLGTLWILGRGDGGAPSAGSVA